MLEPSRSGLGLTVEAGGAGRWPAFEVPSQILRRFPALASLLARRTPPPMLFSVLFWGTLIGVHIIPAIGMFGETWRFGPGWSVVTSVVLVLIWLAVPWNQDAEPWQKIATIAFPVAVLLLDQTLGDSVWAESNYLIAIANGALVFGVGRGFIFAAWVLVCYFLDYLINTILYSSTIAAFPADLAPTLDQVREAFFWTVLFVPYVGFAIGVCLLYLTVRRSREETLSLLGELEIVHRDLQAANVALNQQLQQSRELVILEERARIARDIHDTLGHHLTAINLQLEHARKLRTQQPDVAWEEVGETKTLALEALAEVRRCVRALKPLVLEERSGLGALSALCRTFESTDLEATFAVSGTPYPLSPEMEITLYRALQGSLTNVVRHAGARRVSVLIVFADTEVEFRVADDGQGVDEDRMEEGFGLEALRERAALLGGNLTVGNGAAGGFLFVLRIPTSEKAR